MIRTEGAAGTSSGGRGVITTVVETEIEATIVRRDRGEVMTPALALVADEAEMIMKMRAESVSLEAQAVMVVVAESGAHLQNE